MGRRNRDRIVVGFITTCAISAYHHYSYEFESRSWCGLLDATLCDKVCQWLATGRWFPPGTPDSSNKTDRHDITIISLKVALNTINQTCPTLLMNYMSTINYWLNCIYRRRLLGDCCAWVEPKKRGVRTSYMYNCQRRCWIFEHSEEDMNLIR